MEKIANMNKNDRSIFLYVLYKLYLYKTVLTVLINSKYLYRLAQNVKFYR